MVLCPSFIGSIVEKALLFGTPFDITWIFRFIYGVIRLSGDGSTFEDAADEM